MKSFRIISTAWGLVLFSMLLIIFSGVLLFINILPAWSNISVIAALSLIGVWFYLQRFISRAEIEITLSKDHITIKWLRQYIFHKEADRKIFFNEIKCYMYEEDRNFDLFRITLLDDTEIDFWHFTFTKDDFYDLVYTFPEFVKRHNKIVETIDPEKNPIHKPKKIERTKTIYEKATSPFIVILSILLIVAISIIMIFEKDEVANPFMGLATISGALFYLMQYFKYRKRNKSSKD